MNGVSISAARTSTPTARVTRWRRALYGQRARRFVRVDAVAQGNAAIRVGSHVTIAGVNPFFENTYVVVEAIHRFDLESGYLTDFIAEGAFLGEGVMKPTGPFATPASWMAGAHLGRVLSVQDPLGLSRVQLTLLGADADGEAPLWARVAVPFAGDNRGAFLIPDVGDEVLVLFIGNDPRYPVVVGGLWNGSISVPEQIGSDRIDRWTITGKAGTRVAIIEESSGQEMVEIETPGGVTATLTDASGGSIKLKAAGSTVTIDSQGVSIQTGGKFSVTANQINMTAGQVKVQTGLADFSHVIKCQTVQTPAVVSTSYTPGAGNIW